jgi:molybdopterin-biosynthesis enzyme MoeA-like protein
MSGKLRAVIIVVSETATGDPSTDKCIPALQDVFAREGADRWDEPEAVIVPDDISAIQKAITRYTDGAESTNLIVTSGGTGFAQKDVTPEVGQNIIPLASNSSTPNHAARLTQDVRPSRRSFTNMHQALFTVCWLRRCKSHLSQSCPGLWQACET